MRRSVPPPQARATAPLTFLLALTVGLSAAGPGRAAPREDLAAARLAEALPAGAVLVRAPDGRVEALRGLSLVLSASPGGAADEARDWLIAHGEAFGLGAPTDGLRLEHTETLPDGGRRLLFRQEREGVPLWGADARCVLSPRGALVSVCANFRPPGAEVPDTSPRLPASRAAAVATAAGADLRDPHAEVRLWWRPGASGERLAWAVSAGLAGRVWVDAADGTLLGVEDGVARAVGYAYPSDPRGPLAEVVLERLVPGSGLASRWVAVEDQSAGKVQPLAPDDYRYTPDQPGFDQVNAYWQADRFLYGALGALGYPGPPESLIVRVQVPLDPNVALTSGRLVLLGRAIPGATNDAARARDVIDHELVHAVLYGKGVQPGGPRREAGALHEALADYFAAAVTGDPAIGEWVYLAFPGGATRVDMPPDPWDMAHYDRVSFASAPVASVWANGMILSSALWDLRARLGTTADSLVLEALDDLPTLPTWAQFANAVLRADQDRRGAAHAGDIVWALGRRGIRGALVAGVSGPVALAPGDSGTFVASPCCDGVGGTFAWAVRGWCRGRPCSDWRPLGAMPAVRVAFDDDAELRLVATSPWGESDTTTRFVDVRSPSVFLEGPERVLVRAPSTWRARAAAVGPYVLQWERRDRVNGALYRFVGTGGEQTFTPDTDFDLRVTVVDGMLRRAQATLGVVTFRDTGQAPERRFRLSQVLAAGATVAETRLELAGIGRLQVHVLDVQGRVRRQLADGPAGAGGHVLRWDPSGLEPGVYLLRVRHGAEGGVLRFAVVR